ncbi:hypothetical protein HK102_004168 [Quaeritorhiza haematococci]|nr:hypothetical protein HK102_004168 [Quaeritorhiza haematococci]
MEPTKISSAAGAVAIMDFNGSRFVSIAFTGLAPDTKYAIHIHQFGDISDANGANTFLHFNPTNQSHGCPTYTNPEADRRIHVGDLGSLDTDAHGSVNALIGPLQTISFDPFDPGFVIGRGLELHSQVDDCRSQPTGNSGTRMSQGVIGWTGTNNLISSPTERVVAEPEGLVSAIAVLSSTDAFPNVVGEVYFTQQNATAEIRVQAEVRGLKPDSVFGWHIHETGDLSRTDGSTARGHFNPTNNSRHGCPSFSPFRRDNTTASAPTDIHAGDLGNIRSNQNGVALVDFVIDASSPLNLFRGTTQKTGYVVGRVVGIQSREDDCQFNGPVQLMAWGVIGYRNSSVPILFSSTNGAAGAGSSSQQPGMSPTPVPTPPNASETPTTASAQTTSAGFSLFRQGTPSFSSIMPCTVFMSILVMLLT